MAINELKENQSYSCTDCDRVIEIMSLNDETNSLIFKCPIHGEKEMSIKDYLSNMKKNTFLYSECSLCKKNQNEANNNEIFDYCKQCKLVICNNCKASHDNNHCLIKNNRKLTNCLEHPKNYNISYCFDCNCHICKECIEHRKHMRHYVRAIKDNEPSNEEVNNLLNLIHKYKDQINSSEIEKRKKLIEIEDEFIKNKEQKKADYENSIINTKNNLQKELTENENNYNNQIEEIKKKYEEELKKKKESYEVKRISINSRYEQKNIDNERKYKDCCTNLEKIYNNNIKQFEDSCKEKINKFEELLNINSIIYNTYNKSRENYFHNINIINLLINYYKRGNETISVMKDNEDFMETIKQKEDEYDRSLNKSYAQENKFINDFSLSEDKDRANTTPRIRDQNKNFLTNIDNNQPNLNNDNIIKNLNQNFINKAEDNKELNLNNNKNNNYFQNLVQIYDYNNEILNEDVKKNEFNNNNHPNDELIINNNYYYNADNMNQNLNIINNFNINKPNNNVNFINRKGIYQKNIKNPIVKNKTKTLIKKDFEENPKNNF